MAESKPVYCLECNYNIGSYALDQRGRYVRETHANDSTCKHPPAVTCPHLIEAFRRPTQGDRITDCHDALIRVSAFSIGVGETVTIPSNGLSKSSAIMTVIAIVTAHKKGKIVKQNDHLMDATQYLVLSGLQVACREPREEEEDNRQWIDSTRNEYMGY